MATLVSATALDRRAFLKTGAAVGAGLCIGFHIPASAADDPAQQQEKKTPNPFNAWVHITPDNRITLLLEKSEMGQGIMTAVPMILAEELCVDWRNVTVQQAPTDPDVYNHGTGGSGSVAGCWLPMRRAGAAAREMLISAAAARWGVNTNTCVAKNGGVLHGARNNFLTYGELANDAAKLPIPNLNTVPLKNSDDFTIVGKATPRFEAASKTNGKAVFGIDSRVPGMQYAVVARCPIFGGKVKSFDAAKAKAVAGVRDVFPIDPVEQGAFSAGGVAIIADNSWAAIEGRKALEVKWDEGPHAGESSETLHKHFLDNAAKPGKPYRNDGDADAAIASASKKVEATYEFPFAAHATMEPMNCTVHIRPDSAEAWVPTQAPQWAQEIIAGVSKLPKDKIKVNTTLMGGGFGRRYMADFVMEAAQISKQTGKPVMVLWTREDDMQHDFYRPASYHRFAGAIDNQGNISAWKHFQTSTSIEAMWSPKGKETPEKSEFATAAFIPYQTQNYRVEYTLAESGVPRAWWRSVEHSTSGFVVECFVDELASAAGADPLEFRLRSIGGDRKIPDFTDPKEGKPLDTARLKGVLKLAAEKAGWGSPLPKGTARGVAGYYSFNTYTAAVAEVSMKDGMPKIHRLVYAVDCGRPVNPDGIRAQVEGAAIYGLSATLHDAITIKNGAVVQTNFHEYQMPRIADTPKTEIHIVESKEEPTGIGEPGLPVVAASVCNAIYSLTKKRVRRLPIRSGDLTTA
ncbi:MAG TPA: xanthine dehydrogenase family protein molybdopterin-binding subunit [Candidatus Eisenbacteria bacterium]|jgi:CO/xanthine dehydrogenase Mo-binding subunit|nr:xanthine dehydrogenase family protein molybdopterin-binding subunit [Candidatus Eisenbacteria bacterium]